MRFILILTVMKLTFYAGVIKEEQQETMVSLGAGQYQGKVLTWLKELGMFFARATANLADRRAIVWGTVSYDQEKEIDFELKIS